MSVQLGGGSGQSSWGGVQSSQGDGSVQLGGGGGQSSWGGQSSRRRSVQPGGSAGGGSAKIGQQNEYSLHSRRYASCVHAGGISCFNHNFFILGAVLP